MSNNELIL